MAEATVSDLRVRLEAIRDERSTHANTAHRIGSAMLELLSYAEAVAGSVDLSDLETAIAQKVNLANLTELMTPLDSQMNPIGWNEATLANTAHLRVNVNLFSVGGVSALGAASSGGGGGDVTLTEPLASINAAGLGTPTTANVGIVWNGSRWVYGSTGGGGGTDLAAVWASLNGNTDLYGSTKINAAHIPDLSGTYQTVISDLDTIRSRANWGREAYLWGDHAQAGYLTEETFKGTVTSVGLSMPTGFSVSGSPVTSAGTLAVSMASGYAIPTTAKQLNWDTAYNRSHTHSNKSVLDGITSAKISNWDTAYGWGDHADAGYMLRSEGMRFLSSGSYIAARFVTASGSPDTARATEAQTYHIEWWSSGGYFNHEFGNAAAKGNVTIGTGNTDTTHFLQIGGGKICWDDENKALYVQQENGTAAHFYATGGVSALGIGVSGTANLNTLTLGTLNVTGTAIVNTLTVNNEISAMQINQLDVTNWLMMNGCDIYMDGGSISDVNDMGVAQIRVGYGGSTIKKLYWDGTYLQVHIGTKIYKFIPDATSNA